jgi:lysyl-tRNA synthetase class I
MKMFDFLKKDLKKIEIKEIEKMQKLSQEILDLTNRLAVNSEIMYEFRTRTSPIGNEIQDPVKKEEWYQERLEFQEKLTKQTLTSLKNLYHKETYLEKETLKTEEQIEKDEIRIAGKIRCPSCGKMAKGAINNNMVAYNCNCGAKGAMDLRTYKDVLQNNGWSIT